MKIITRKEAIAQGLKRYFTGKPCEYGHVTERYVYGACITCVKEKNAEYQKKNKESIKKSHAEYQKKNKERLSKRRAEYRKKNKERINERQVEHIEILHDSYIKMRLFRQYGIKREDITPDLIEAKRQDLLTKRLMAKIRKGARK